MLKNMDSITQHRRGLEEVAEARREQAAKVIAEMATIGAATENAPSEPSPSRTQKPTSLRERCEDLKENARKNEDVLLAHRGMLQDVAAERRRASERAGLQPDPTPDANLDQPTGMQPMNLEIPVDHSQRGEVDPCAIIRQNADQINASLQATTSDKLDALSPDIEETEEAPDWEKQHAAAEAAAAEERWQKLFGGSDGPRTRPSSAPLGAGRSSRPSSASSMKARCRLLEENVCRNREMLESNRSTLDVVIEFRRSQAEKAMADLGIC